MSVLLNRALAQSYFDHVLYRRVGNEKIQRTVAQRYVSTYRTVLIETVYVLACTPPADLINSGRASGRV